MAGSERQTAIILCRFELGDCDRPTRQAPELTVSSGTKLVAACRHASGGQSSWKHSKNPVYNIGKPMRGKAHRGVRLLRPPSRAPLLLSVRIFRGLASCLPMYHRIAFRKLNRTSSHRKALLRNLVTSLIKHDRIETTVPKAKELRRVADQMVTLAKHPDSFNARRQASAVITEPKIVKKLFAEFPARFAARNGGYTRIVRTGFRFGDAAPVCYIEYLDRPGSHLNVPVAKDTAAVESKP